MRKLMGLGIMVAAAAWVVGRRRGREVANVEDRCAQIDEWARRARVSA